jgi:hypothetical protein
MDGMALCDQPVNKLCSDKSGCAGDKDVHESRWGMEKGGSKVGKKRKRWREF